MLRIAALCLLVCGCTTTLPPKVAFPLPSEILLAAPRPLLVLPGEGEVTPQVLMTTVARNYGVCRENSAAHATLIEWVRRQGEVK
jgi:hypothetical protein